MSRLTRCDECGQEQPNNMAEWLTVRLVITGTDPATWPIDRGDYCSWQCLMRKANLNINRGTTDELLA